MRFKVAVRGSASAGEGKASLPRGGDGKPQSPRGRHRRYVARQGVLCGDRTIVLRLQRRFGRSACQPVFLDAMGRTPRI